MALGEKLARLLSGGEVIELSSDLGGGKTTLVKGLAKGLGCKDEVVSPTFTISRVYQLPSGKELQHYDFYRLAPDDITAEELAEAAGQPDKIVVIEWAGNVGTHLPEDRLKVTIATTGENDRDINFSGTEKYAHIIEGLKS
jgi:tRNA threonylcarbamoyladenosine biosynthesis protein TsaE